VKKQLQVFKPDIITIFPNQKVKFHHHSTDYIERLSFDYRLDDEITKINFVFSLVKANNALSLSYDFLKTPKKKAPKKASYSLSNISKDAVLPGFSLSDNEKIMTIQKYRLDGELIMAESTLEDQMKVYLSVIGSNLDAIIEAVKTFSELN